MDRNDILTTLRSHALELRRSGISSLFLFGSAAREDAGPNSDVDLFFDFDDPHFSLVELVALQSRIADLLHTPADVMSRGSIHPRLRPSIEGSAVRVF